MTKPNARTVERLSQLLKRFGVRRDHPAPVDEEVDQFVAKPGIDDESLVDLTDLPFVTIDNVDSRDLDQALALRREEGGYVVDYALADAAHAVRPGTALFDEALKRGATFYLPGLAVPMLPRALSEGLVSLNPKVKRRALNMRMHLDEGGSPKRTEIFRARIESRAKLSYAGVDRWLAGASDEFDDEPFAESLRLLKEVGELRMQDLVERDVVQHHRRSTELTLDDNGDLAIVSRARRKVDRYNEQISLLCNIEGARFLRRCANPALQPIFKVHEKPPESRVEELETRIRGIADAHGAPAEFRWRPRRKHDDGETLATFLKRLPMSGPQAPISRAIHRQAIWINRRSEFAVEAGPHHGIGAEEYARFSAPMREIVGIFTHKETLEALADVDVDVDRDRELQAQVVEISNRAKSVQSRLDKEAELIALDRILEGDLENGRPPRDALVVGLAKNRAYLDIESPPLEVKLYGADLQSALGENLKLSDCGAHLSGDDGRLAIGDRIQVRVSAKKKSRWSFEVVRRS